MKLKRFGILQNFTLLHLDEIPEEIRSLCLKVIILSIKIELFNSLTVVQEVRQSSGQR